MLCAPGDGPGVDQQDLLGEGVETRGHVPAGQVPSDDDPRGGRSAHLDDAGGGARVDHRRDLVDDALDGAGVGVDAHRGDLLVQAGPLAAQEREGPLGVHPQQRAVALASGAPHQLLVVHVDVDDAHAAQELAHTGGHDGPAAQGDDGAHAERPLDGAGLLLPEGHLPLLGEDRGDGGALLLFDEGVGVDVRDAEGPGEPAPHVGFARARHADQDDGERQSLGHSLSSTRFR